MFVFIPVDHLRQCCACSLHVLQELNPVPDQRTRKSHAHFDLLQDSAQSDLCGGFSISRSEPLSESKCCIPIIVYILYCEGW